ncbi:MAG TPA: hypothetical protein VN578_12970 [Candidatus Binatia bacterium]|jgi:hypothetical protein|nr:hypothetical protein [Candidatus Binatia bacterium]
MKPRICICCGETMSERGNALSRNPNVCASCSSLADGMDDPVPEPIAPEVLPKATGASDPEPPHTDEVIVEWTAEKPRKEPLPEKAGADPR